MAFSKTWCLVVGIVVAIIQTSRLSWRLDGTTQVTFSKAVVQGDKAINNINITQAPLRGTVPLRRIPNVLARKLHGNVAQGVAYVNISHQPFKHLRRLHRKINISRKARNRIRRAASLNAPTFANHDLNKSLHTSIRGPGREDLYLPDWPRIVDHNLGITVNAFGHFTLKNVASKNLQSTLMYYDGTCPRPCKLHTIGKVRSNAVVKYWRVFFNKFNVCEELSSSVVFNLAGVDLAKMMRVKPKQHGFVTGVSARIGSTVPLFPNWQHIDNLGKDRYKDIKRSAAAVKWDDKEDVVVWRGTMNWIPLKSEKRDVEYVKSFLLAKSRRLRLVRAASELNSVDVKISGIKRRGRREFYWKNKSLSGVEELLEVGYIPENEYLTKYKHVVVIAGIGAAFRLSLHLAAGQAVLLDTEGSVEWYYQHLRPWKEYIPFNGPENLRDAVRFVRENPQATFLIARRGQAFFEHFLSAHATKSFVVTSLNYIASHLQQSSSFSFPNTTTC